MPYILALLFLTLSACAAGDKATVPFATDADGQAHVNLPGTYTVKIFRDNDPNPVRIEKHLCVNSVNGLLSCNPLE